MNFEGAVKNDAQRWQSIVDFITEKSRTPYDHVMTRLKYYNTQSSRSLSRNKRSHNIISKSNNSSKDNDIGNNLVLSRNDSRNQQDVWSPSRMMYLIVNEFIGIWRKS